MTHNLINKVGENNMTNKHGTIRIKLTEITLSRKMSKNKVMKRAEMQRTQLNHYYRNEISRIDLDVLARLCFALNCNIDDILEFVPPNISTSSNK